MAQYAQPLNPFVVFCQKTIPLAFDESMSYMEALYALKDYLEEQIIPTVNTNAQAVDDLTNLYNELHDYVEHYFDNLDVQEEINNKLDDMAEDGTLEEIITSYIQSNVAWVFDTVADMKLAENLVNGSYARTLGFRSLNDGGGATYYITNSGTANELDVIAVGDSLYAHFVKPTIVSPEMFGAYGDNTHDDTDAWNKAVSFKLPVKAYEKTYKVSTIEVTDDIDIDCGNASFVSSATRIFNIHGTLVTSLPNENNYTANDIDYAISATGYTTYTGFAFVHGDNNFEVSRSYYVGGFACTFDNGKITSSYPIPVENTVIDLIRPIRGSLKNIKNLSHSTVSDQNRSILVKYGEGYQIENVFSKNAQAYVDIDIEKSINVTCKNLNITHNVTFSDDVSYIVYIEDSSFCTVRDSYLYNKKWHAWTTSGLYLCYKNSVLDSALLSDAVYSVADHANALATTLDNLTTTCIHICGLSYVNNIKMYPAKDSNRRCHISLETPSINGNGKFVITNIYQSYDASTNNNYAGILFNNAPQVTGGTYYFNEVYIENVKHTKNVIAGVKFQNLPSTSNFVIEKITMKNADLDFEFPETSNTNITTTNSEVLLEDLNAHIVSKRADIGRTNSKFNILQLNNCYVRKIRGSATTLIVNNFRATQDISNDEFSCTNLYGTNVMGYIKHALINACTIVNISNMYMNSSRQQFNFVKANGTVYYQEVNTSTGLFETKTIS